MSVASALVDNYVNVHDTGEGSNKLLNQVYDVIGKYFKSRKFLDTQQTDYGWFNKMDILRQGNLRVGTWCLRSLGSQSPKILAPNENDPRDDDGGSRFNLKKGINDLPSGTELISRRPIALSMPNKSRKVLEAYLFSLLGTELSAVCDTALRAGDSKHYRAIVSLDYYSSRALTANKAHRDTVGNTLFVALHYRNTERMAGPEYIIDRWPIPAKHGVTAHFNAATARGDEQRLSAPWTVGGGPCPRTYWPHQLLIDLENARSKLKKKNTAITFESSVLEPNGLISFVDELIFHLTPLREHRKIDSSYDDFNRVSIAPQQEFDIIPGLPNLIRGADIRRRAGRWFGCGPKWESYDVKPLERGRHKLARRMSADLSSPTKTVPSTTGGLDVRQFLRLWISIVPSAWYSQLDVT